jgi:TetR/AcrR family transcriptional regulator, regulator of cefoperazone and chloramphenicol sensitivity
VLAIYAHANANVAAVNYHFRDKVGLYLDVLRETLTVQTDSLQEALGHAQKPEQALRLFITAVLRRIFGRGEQSLRTRIMVHELAQPSLALKQVVEEVIRPNYDRLRQLVGQIIRRSPDDDITRLCTHSIIAQIVHYAHARPVISILWPDLKMTPERCDQVANHIADFSICSLQPLVKKDRQRRESKKEKRKSHGSSIHSRNRTRETNE